MAPSSNQILSTKIRQAIASAEGLDKKTIAEKLGITKQSVTGWETTGRISKGNLTKLAELLSVQLSWFLHDDLDIPVPKASGPASNSVAESAFDKNVKEAKLGRRAIPVISAIQAGAMREITEPYELGAGYATLYTDDDYSRWAFGLEIEGDSMLPEFRPGDLVIIEPEWEPRPGEYVAAKNGRQEATFKKYRQRGTDQNGRDIFELVPLNEDYPILRSDETPLVIIGVMAEHRRKARNR